MPKTALIDGDIVVYRIAAAAERATQWDEDLWTLHAHFEEARQVLDEQLKRILTLTGCDELRPAVSGKSNFRYDLYPEYKSSRKTTRRPMLLKPLLDYLIEEYDGFRHDEMEADDVLGIWATKAKFGKTVIVTSDKDLRTVPGLHYNPNKPSEGIVTVTEEDGQRFHMIQTLTGDTVDDIPGCPSYGPVKASKAIPEGMHLVDMWEKVVDCFIAKDLTPDDALLNARLTRILHAEDYDFETRKVVLWEPPQ